MDSKLLLLYGLVGSSVKSVQSLRVYPTKPETMYPVPGDRGVVVGMYWDNVGDPRVLVRMEDSPEDWEDLLYSDFYSYFAINTSQRKFKQILRG